MYEEELTYKIRGCVYEVYRTLGAGFLEVVYQNALIKEIQLQGLRVNSEVPLQVLYKEQLVGEFRTDLIVDNKVLLINFSYPKAIIKRIIY